MTNSETFKIIKGDVNLYFGPESEREKFLETLACEIDTGDSGEFERNFERIENETRAAQLSHLLLRFGFDCVFSKCLPFQ